MHYCAACGEPELIWDILIEADCDASICDKKGNPAAYYLEHHSEIELPESERMVSRKVVSQKESKSFNKKKIIFVNNSLKRMLSIFNNSHFNSFANTEKQILFFINYAYNFFSNLFQV